MLLLAGVVAFQLVVLSPVFVGGPTSLRGSTARLAVQPLRACGGCDTGCEGCSGTPALPAAGKQDDSEVQYRLGDFAGAALSMLAALLVAFAPAAPAQAARSGGRMGGSAPSARAPPPRPSAPRASAPNVVNKTTVVERTTVVAPPPVVVAPPMGMGMGYGGFGMAPVVVAPPPTLGDVIIGAAVSSSINNAMRGPSTTDRIMENQMRQDERQMDKQSAQIDDLKRQIADLKK